MVVTSCTVCTAVYSTVLLVVIWFFLGTVEESVTVLYTHSIVIIIFIIIVRVCRRRNVKVRVEIQLL